MIVVGEAVTGYDAVSVAETDGCIVDEDIGLQGGSSAGPGEMTSGRRHELCRAPSFHYLTSASASSLEPAPLIWSPVIIGGS